MSGEQDITKMGGLWKKLPVTGWTFLIGVLAIAGFPFTSGFVSKDEILLAVYSHNKIYFWIAAFTAVLTAIYMFRLLMLTFFGGFRGTEDQKHHLHESPWQMTLPLVLLALLSVAGGWIQLPHIFGGHPFLNEYLSKAVPALSHDDANLALKEYILLAGTVTGLVIIYFATKKFFAVDQFEGAYRGIKKWMADKWYVDELYEAIISKPVRTVSGFFNNIIERFVIDGLVNGVGRVVNYGGRQLRLLQSGQVGAYILMMVIGMVLLFVIQFILKK
jgi:NADH-quinone oxidoreductase subunit L